jgi:hypothetical protein
LGVLSILFNDDSGEDFFIFFSPEKVNHERCIWALRFLRQDFIQDGNRFIDELL